MLCYSLARCCPPPEDSSDAYLWGLDLASFGYQQRSQPKGLSEAGLPHLRKLQLTSLDLSMWVQLTDKGLSHLQVEIDELISICLGLRVWADGLGLRYSGGGSCR